MAFLLDNVEHELNNNHVERNLAALCLYFSYAESVPTRIAARLERDVAHLLETTILPDGCQVERSPMYQGLSVASLAIMAETPFLSGSLRSKLQERQAAAHRAFAILSHPDGEVALFNDSWHGEAPHYHGLGTSYGVPEIKASPIDDEAHDTTQTRPRRLRKQDQQFGFEKTANLPSKKVAN